MAERKSYDAQFKEAALKRLENETVKEVADDLGVSANTLTSWKKPVRTGVKSSIKSQSYSLKAAFQEELENIDKRKQEIEDAYQNELPKLDTRKKLLDELLKTY